MPSPEQRKRMRTQFEIMSVPLQESVADILTVSHQSTCPSWQPGNSDSDTKNSLVLGFHDAQPGSTGGRNDFPQQLTNLELFNVRTRTSRSRYLQTTPRAAPPYLKEKMRSDIQRQTGTWNVHWSHASSSSSTDWWKLGKWHEPQQGEWQHK